ncbi:LysR family transcriptional regulator [Clostridium aminobutyricum]|uniref:LysR family transcriptional regulator n=1 Tax=Clostridium aminobutyricum TaxID=33953 RepID=A0A939D670_CLOAM|nr:LysR family transcriptional regulator [Clostridium aminobutyricum]MBN7771802.1 LysR family transcriptional regulator [Clostridium aminobutyricum]
MDLHYLEIFNAVAQHESYKKASDILHISQPALSVQIKKLEEQIGLKLFNKIGNKICLSENGFMLQGYTNRIFDIIEELENGIADKKGYIGGTLHLGGSNTPGTYLLPEIIGEFKKQYPTIEINLDIANTTEVAHLINNGTLDIAINGGSYLYSNYIFAEKLLDDKLIIVASPENPYCNHQNITRDDLSKMNFVVHKTNSQLYIYYKKLIDELDLPENISMCLGNIDAIKRAVGSNLGVTLIPYVAVKFELQFGLLKRLNAPDFEFDYSYSLIYNKNKALSSASIKFIEFIREHMKDYSFNDQPY